MPPGHKAGWDLSDEYTAIQNVEEGKFSPTWGVWQGGMGHLDGTFGMVCKHCYDEMGEDKFLTTPIGTGAFEVVRWAGHDELVLEAVPDHWQRTANVKTVRVFELLEQATMEAALLAGEIDFAPIVARRLSGDRPGHQRHRDKDGYALAQFHNLLGQLLGGNLSCPVPKANRI